MSRRRPVNGRQAAWLAAPGSLSRRLHQARPPLTVQQLAQGRCPADGRRWPGGRALSGRGAWQGDALGGHTWLGSGALHGRSVLLRGGGQPLVLARSAALAAAVSGPWRALRALGSRSLGELLFASLPLRRSALQWQWLPTATPEVRAMRHDWAQADAGSAPRGGVWRRWSVFQRQGCALWVAEYFTPQVLAKLPPTGRGRRR